MANKPKFLKNLLTTASALAVITSAANAYGVDVITTGNGAADVNVGTNFLVAGALVGGGVANNSNIIIGVGQPLTLNKAGGQFGNLNLYGFNTTITQTASSTFTGIISDTSTTAQNAAKAAANTPAAPNPATPAVGGQGANAKANFVLGAGAVATFDNSNVGVLGTIQFTDANAVANFNGQNMTVSQAITTSGAGIGKIVVGATGVKFGTDIGAGANTINAFTVNDGMDATLNGNLLAANAVTLGSAGNGGTLTVATGKAITASDITGSVANKGILNFAGASAVTGTIGATQALAAVNLDGPGVVEMLTGNALKAQNINFGDEKANLKLTTAGTTVTGNLVAETAGDGIVTLNAANPIFVGNVGSSTASIGSIVFAGNAATFSQVTAGTALMVNAEAFTGNNTAVAVFKGDTITIDTNIGTKAAPFANVSIQPSAALPAAITTTTLAPNAVIYSTKFDIAPTAVSNVLILSDGSAINGAIVPTSANSGVLQVAGDSTVGAVGTDNTAAANVASNAVNIDKIDFTTAGKTLTITGGSYLNVQNGTKFTQDATLEYTGKTSNYGVSEIDVSAATGSIGTITANAIPAKVNNAPGYLALGAVGDATSNAPKGLKLLQVNGGANIVLSAEAAVGAGVGVFDTNIATVDIGTQDAALILGSTAAAGTNVNYLIGNFAHDAGSGTLVINDQSVTLKAGSFAKDNALKNIAFAGNNTLIVEDGVNLTTTTATGAGIVNNYNINGAAAAAVPSQATITFQGASKVDAPVGSANAKIAAINILNANNAADKIVEFTQPVFATNVLVGSNATVQFDSTMSAVDGAAQSTGTVIINNGSKAIVLDKTAVVGGANGLDTVTLAGTALVTFNNDIKTKNLNFGSDTASASFAGLTANSDFANSTITTTSTKGMNSLTLTPGIGQTFTQAVGSKTNPFGNIIIAGTTTSDVVTVTGQFYASIGTVSSGKGIVNISGGNPINLGSSDKVLDTINMSSTVPVSGNVYANTVINTGTASFGGIVSAKTFTNANGNATFGAGSVLNVNLDGGSATFGGGSTINNAVGKGTALTTATFSGKGVTTLNNNVSAAAIAITGTSINVIADNAVLGTGPTTVTNSTINLNDNNLKLAAGASAISGANNTIALTVNSDENGTITVDGKTSSLTVSSTQLNINVTDQSSSLPSSASQTYQIVQTSNGGTFTIAPATTVAVTSTGNNNFVTWTYAGKGLIARNNNASAALQSSVSSLNNAVLSTDAANLGNVANTGSALATVIDFSKLDSAKLPEAISRLTNPLVTTNQAVQGVATAVNVSVANRMQHVNMNNVTIRSADANATGVAAGDMESIYGAWINPFFGTGTQKKRSGASGYKADSVGGTIGFDAMVSDSTVLGIAGTYARTEVKHKNTNSGDKTKFDTYMLSIYGTQQLVDNWSAQGSAAFSSNRAKNTEVRITSTGNQKAKGSFNTTIYTLEGMVGYDYKVDEASVTPLIGAAFTRINEGGYKETGTTSQNLSITKKAINKFEVIAGLRANMAVSEMNDMTVTPEVHAFIRQDLIGKNPRVTITLDGLQTPITPKTAKAIKTMYNLGLGVNAKSGMYEYGVGYDFTGANKYMAHQGTVKLRVNF